MAHYVEKRMARPPLEQIENIIKLGFVLVNARITSQSKHHPSADIFEPTAAPAKLEAETPTAILNQHIRANTDRDLATPHNTQPTLANPKNLNILL
jgi:hypothetical protein